jgi:CRP/FNR family transcriptional regulator, cyclic AMP receptor protein
MPYFHEVRWSFLLTRLEYPSHGGKTWPFAVRCPLHVCSSDFERELPYHNNSFARQAEEKHHRDQAAAVIRSTILSRQGRRGPKHATYSKDQIIFSQGDPANAVFYIQRGKVKITVVSELGKEAVVAILDANEFFGEACLAGQSQRIATVTAIIESVIMRLDKAAVVRVIHDEPAFSEMFISHLLGRTIRIEADLVDQLFNSSEKRLARLLLLLANFGKDGKPEPMIAKISQETLAEMIGTTRSRVRYFMNKFRKLGLIDYKSNEGGIEVHSSLLNLVLHEQPEIRVNFRPAGDRT